jgi:hypothetical protein
MPRIDLNNPTELQKLLNTIDLDSKETLYEKASQLVSENRRALIDRIAPLRTRHITVALEDVSFTVTVGSSLLIGDVTGEGNVNAADVTALVNYILGRGTLANEAAAYVNDDTKIDIQDVTARIGIIKKM